jgi:teichoic acid transport system permease protein
MGRYVREAWRRREFAIELARTKLRAKHLNTAFGQLWLLLNPLLLAGIYFLLVDIIRRHHQGPDFFAHLMAGLFAFQIVQTAVTEGARSVVSGERLIMNTAFPRSLLPLSSVMISLRRFLPTVLVYIPMHAVAGLPLRVTVLWVIPILGLIGLIASGAALVAAAAQVYFRDLASFLPYLTRIWLYGSPVLYRFDELSDHAKHILLINPLTPLLASLSDVLQKGATPKLWLMGIGVAWAVAIVGAGAYFFISREREFAVRL